MIKPQKIDLSKADGHTVTDADLVVRRLKKDRQYTPYLLYHGFNGERLEIMLEHGTDTPDSDMIFCGNENELRESGTEATMNALAYAMDQPIPALSVYDGSKLTTGDCYQRQRFIDPTRKLDALVAVYLLQE